MQTVIHLTVSAADALNVAASLTGIYPDVTVAMTSNRLYAYGDVDGPNILEAFIHPSGQGSRIEVESFDDSGRRTAQWLTEQFVR